jgi:hypothetical protein
MPSVAMKHEKDPRDVILDEIGDLSKFEIANNEVLVATYRRPEKTRGGIILTPYNLNEDLYQSKAGLVVKIGPDWPSDCWALEVNFVHCRLVYADQIRVRIAYPGMVW